MLACPQCSNAVSETSTVCEYCRFPLGARKARDPYDVVAEELQRNSITPGLWTRAYAEAGGDESRARALYIQYRVAQLSPAKSDPPTTSSSAIPSVPDPPKTKHFGRRAYFFSMIGIGTVSTFLYYNEGTRVFAIFVGLICLVPIFFRLRDIGMDTSLCLLAFVPIANLVLGYLLLSAPPDFASERRMDATMKVITWTLFSFVAVTLVTMCVKFSQ